MLVRVCAQLHVNMIIILHPHPGGDACIFAKSSPITDAASEHVKSTAAGGKRHVHVDDDVKNDDSAPIVKRPKVEENQATHTTMEHSSCGDSNVDVGARMPTTGMCLVEDDDGGDDIYRTGAKCVPGGPQDPLEAGSRYHVTGALRFAFGTVLPCCVGLSTTESHMEPLAPLLVV